MASFQGSVRSRFARAIRECCDPVIEGLEERRLFAVGALAGATFNLGGPMGPDVADPVQDVAYVANNGTNQILAINTDTGTLNTAATAAAPIGGLAVSPDDTELFATEPTLDQVQIFSTVDLSLISTINVGTSLTQIVALANNEFASNTNGVTIFDENSGQPLYTLPGVSNELLRASADGTMLFVRGMGVNGVTAPVSVYNTSATGAPVAEAAIPAPVASGSTDYFVDPIGGFAYLGDAGATGIEVTQLSNSALSVWTGGATNNIGAFDGSTTIDDITTGNVAEQFTNTGTEENALTLSTAANPESLVMTPNGNAVYTTATGVGILGLSTLSLTETPHLAFQIQPSNIDSGAKFSPTVTVAIEDITGAVISTDNTDVTLGSNIATLGGASTVGAVHGIATFTGLTATGSGTDFLTASDGGDITAQSNDYQITAPKLVFIQQPDQVQPNVALSPVVRVAIEDQYGDLRTFDNSVITLNVNSGPGNINGGLTVEAVAHDGIATFSNIVLGATSGTVTLAASSGADTTAVSQPIVIDSAANTNHLAIVTEPSSVAPLSSMTPGVVVEIANFSGQVVNSTAPVTISVNSGPGLVNGTTTVNAVNGIADFSNLIFPQSGYYTLSVSSPDGTEATTSQFLVGNNLVFAQLPGSPIAGQRIAPSVIIEDVDSDANLVTSFDSPVTLTLSSGPTDSLIGTTTINASGGVADFKNLSIDQTGTYTLTASSNGSTITSSTFVVRAAPATHLAFITQPESVLAGQTFVPIEVAVEDQFGNIITTYKKGSVKLKLVSASAKGTLQNNTVKLVNGVAIFETLAANGGSGSYELRASSGKLVGYSNSFVLTSVSADTVHLLA